MMRRLIQIILFFALPIGVILLCLLTMSSMRSSMYCPAIPQHKTVMIIGNSHPECAIVEQVEDVYVNLGKSGECFYYSVKKAEWLVANNPQLKQIWIELAPNQFMPHMEKWIKDEEYEQRAMLSFPFLMDTQWEWGAWKKAPLATLQTKLVQARRFWGAVISPNWEEDRVGLKWGMFREMKGRSTKFENPEEDEKRIIQPFEENWMALETFCLEMKKYGIEVNAFQCPEYRKNHNFRPIMEYCHKRGLAINRYQEVEFDVNDSTLFYDVSHLNMKGAKVYTQKFRKVLSN
jgi:hypothetical protein